MMKLFCCLILLITVIHCHKILVYQTAPGASHVHFSGKLVDVLVDAGHTVDKLIVEWSPVKSDGTTKATRIRRFELSKRSPWLSMPHMVNPFESKFYAMGDDEPIFYRKTLADFCDEMLNDSKLLEWIKEGKYDAAFSSSYDACGLGLFYLANIKPVFVYSPTPMIDHWAMLLGIPNPASFVPNALRNNDEGDVLSALQKLSVLSDRTYQQQVVLPSYHDVQTEVFRKHFGPSFPSVTDLSKQISQIFINSHPLLELQRPYSNKVRQIGGITLKKLGKLDLDMEEILETPSKGTILFSFGSLVKISSVPEEVLLKFLEAFKHFPEYNIIWKFEDHRPELFENSTNVFPVKWVQQNELLNDDRVKLFITHTGLNSLLETTHAGKPTLSIPLFLDQHYNAQVMVKRGTGIKLDKTKITVSLLVESIQALLENPIYMQNAQTLKKMLEKFPIKSKTTLLDWTDYGIEFPELEKHFTLESANQNIFEYFCLDAICLLFAFIFVAFCAIFTAFKVISRIFTLNFFKIKLD